MALTINTNVASLTAQRNLNRTSLGMDRSLQRLSSGLRINSARDDAAGLAISDRMTAQIRGLNQAARNANDGISVAQTAEGALSEMTNVLQRMRELAVQSANTTNNASDRDSLNREVQQLIEEFDRIANQTQFNGIKILTGDFSGQFQVGPDVGQTIGVSIEDIRGDNVGISTNYGTLDTEMATSGYSDFFARMAGIDSAGFSSHTINGVSISDVSLANGHNNTKAKVDAINQQSAASGVSAFSVGNALIGATVSSYSGTLSTGDVVINGVEITGAATQGNFINNINAKTGDTGVTAKVVNNKIILINTTSSAISMRANTVTAMSAMGQTETVTTVAAGQNGAIVLNNDINSTTIEFNQASMGLALLGASGVSTTLAQEKVAGLSVSSVQSANLTILAADQGIGTVDNLRSKLGAIQNRLESTIANLMNVSENLSAARSRILDADIASETAIMTKNSILQQAGTAILAQANQQPQLALQLLG